MAPLTASRWTAAKNLAGEFEDFAKEFVPNGHTPGVGGDFCQSGCSKVVATDRGLAGEAYYRGELAQKFIASIRRKLAAFSPPRIWQHIRRIGSTQFRSSITTFACMSPANGQGLAALQALAILRERDIRGLEPDCPDVQHLGIEAMKLAFADAHQYIADPKYMTVSVEQLLDPKYIAKRAAMVLPDCAGDPKSGTPKDGGTILLAAADAGGTMVTLIQSNYQGFGSGIVIPGTGIHLQNRGRLLRADQGPPQPDRRRKSAPITPSSLASSREKTKSAPRNRSWPSA